MIIETNVAISNNLNLVIIQVVIDVPFFLNNKVDFLFSLVIRWIPNIKVYFNTKISWNVKTKVNWGF